MTYTQKLSLALACGTFLASMPIKAQELAYHLPKGSAAAGMQAKLIFCPSQPFSFPRPAGIAGEADEPEMLSFEGSDARIEHSVLISGSSAKGELVRLNPRSSFLGSRSIALTFHPNGMLKTINAEGEGKGGAIATSLLKTAAGLLTFSGSGMKSRGGAALLNGTVEDPLAPVCKEEVQKQARRLAKLKIDILTAESLLVQGDSLSPKALTLYESQKKEHARLEKKLTLSTSAKFSVTRATILDHFSRSDKPFEQAYFVRPIEYGKWFHNADRIETNVAKHGFCVKASVSKPAFDASTPVESGSRNRWLKKYTASGSLKPKTLMNKFIYFRPVPVQFEVNEVKAEISGAAAERNVACMKLLNEKKAGTLALMKKGSISVPQLSGYFSLPMGSGAFESKATSAEFSDKGGLLAMGTKAHGSGTSIAAGLAGAFAASETFRDGRKNAIQREIDLITAENELKLLLDPDELNSDIVEDGVS
ncbi:MAG: hypothetical protein ABJI04_02380 [Marinomonas sp.]